MSGQKMLCARPREFKPSGPQTPNAMSILKKLC